MKRLIFVLSATLAGCGDIPALDQAISPEAERADYPVLLPLDDSLAPTNGQITGPDLEASLAPRLAALRARAAAMRRPVIDEAAKARLATEVPG